MVKFFHFNAQTVKQELQSICFNLQKKKKLPRSRGDSFLLLVLCGEAPRCSSIFTFSTRSASTARVRAVSPSNVCSSRVKSAAVSTARMMTQTSELHLQLDSTKTWVGNLTLQHDVQHLRTRLHSCCMQRHPTAAVFLLEGGLTARQRLQRISITCRGAATAVASLVKTISN